MILVFYLKAKQNVVKKKNLTKDKYNLKKANRNIN